MKNAITFVHGLLRSHVKHGDVVIDATVGNANDTHLLASLVGIDGLVYGFDVQQLAIDAAYSTLRDSASGLRLLCAGHETMARLIDPHHRGAVAAVTFNLGYLPGGDKTVTTTAETTLDGVAQAIDVLRPGGIATVVCYRHSEGERELAHLRTYLEQLSQKLVTCLETNFINQQGNPAVVFVVEKRNQ